MNLDSMIADTPKENKKKEIKLALEEQWAKESQEPEEPTVETSPSVEELSRKARERDEYLDHLQRLKAEFENYRKRTERERAQWADRLLEDFMMELLDVVDNLHRAQIVAEETHSVESYKEGVEMVFGRLLDVLRSRGLERIATVGEPFDPYLHEAIMQEERTDVEPGTIVEEITPGYVLGDRVLRAPRVKVAR
ncbi:MAG TPA: nucleotide exchange factor GrpE [bacterium]|nr:nucleotide exchange factor GrpE [bacterium]HQO36814.1 nucleotide exchange factor GrpE [bacterium]HQP99479.1 nucleotide exchange factor GrpE [bacterium]